MSDLLKNQGALLLLICEQTVRLASASYEAMVCDFRSMQEQRIVGILPND